MGGALTVPRGAAPRCPACPAGVPISPEKWGERGPGASPLDPRFYGPLAVARSFWRLCHIVPVMGLFRCPSSYPDLGTFFHKMLFQHIFYSKMRPKSVLAYRRKQPLQRIRDNSRQNERVGTSGPSERGGGGSPPATLCVRAFSRESLDPPPGTGREPTPQGPPCAGPEGTTYRQQRPPAPVSAPSKCEKTLKYQGFHLLFLSLWCKITQYAIVQKKRTAPRLRPGAPGAPSPVGRLRL